MSLLGVARRQVIHHRELVVASAFGAQSDLVAVVLNLRLVAQSRLDLSAGGGQQEQSFRVLAQVQGHFFQRMGTAHTKWLKARHSLTIASLGEANHLQTNPSVHKPGWLRQRARLFQRAFSGLF